MVLRYSRWCGRDKFLDLSDYTFRTVFCTVLRALRALKAKKVNGAVDRPEFWLSKGFDWVCCCGENTVLWSELFLDLPGTPASRRQLCNSGG